MIGGSDKRNTSNNYNEPMSSIDAITLHSDMRKLDNESFSNVANLPYGLVYSEAIAYKNFILIFGGRTNNGSHPKMMSVLDTVTDEVYQTSHYSYGSDHSSLVIINETAYSFGGQLDSSSKALCNTLQTLNLTNFGVESLSPTHHSTPSPTLVDDDPASNQMLFELFLTLSSIALIVLWIVSMQQFCISDFEDKQQLKRMLFVIMFIVFAIVLNILLYSRVICGAWNDLKSNITVIQYVCEALFCIYAFHALRMYNMWSLQRRYSPTNTKVPSHYIACFDMLELINLIVANLCYALIWAVNSNFVFVYHIFLNVMVIISSIIHLHSINRIVKLLNSAHRNFDSVADAKQRIKKSVAMVIVLTAANIFAIIIRIDILTNSRITPFNLELAFFYSRSFVLIASSLALILWIYQHKETCSRLNEDSVCVRYGCDICLMFLYDVCNCCASYVETRPFQEQLLGLETDMDGSTNVLKVEMKSNLSTDFKQETRRLTNTAVSRPTITKFSNA